MSYLSIKNLNKYYKITNQPDFHVLKSIDLDLDKGELVSIIGESGSGKSTLMNVIGGLDSDFSGDVVVGGDNIANFSQKDMVLYHKKKVGFVFQSFNLVSHLSVLENVSLAMTLSNVSKKIRQERAKELLEVLGLKEQLHKKPNQLSGGQKQRVAIARALINDPDVIIADEPTGALDSETTEQVLDILESIAADGKLVIMVTHSSRVAQRSNRVITIADGQIKKDETFERHFKKRFHVAAKADQTVKQLSLFSAIKLALLNMKEKLSRNILIALGSSIGIMSVVLMLSLGKGVNDYLNDQMQKNVNPTIAEAQMPVETSTSNGDDEQPDLAGPTSKPFAQSDLDKLATIDHVTEVSKAYSNFSFGGSALTYDDQSYSFMNFSTISAIISPNDIVAGEMPDDQTIMINQSLAEKINQDDPDSLVGQTVSMVLTVDTKQITGDFKISGIYNPNGPSAGIAGALDSVQFTYDHLKKLYEDNGLELEPNAAYLVVDDRQHTDQVKQDIKSLGYSGGDADILADTFSQMIDIFTYVLTGVAAISLVVSAIMILTVMYISVVERTQEIGVMKAIGARKKDIRRIFVSEAFLIGLFGGLIGIGVALLLTVIGNNLIMDLFDTTILHPTLAYLLFGIGISIFISMIASLIPAYSASRLDPVDALRHD